MSDLSTVLADVRASVDELLSTADACTTNWGTPRAPGKWSPSQLVEHVARAFDESAVMVSGRKDHFPSFPRFLRPLARRFFFNPTVRKRRMGKAKTFAFMNPDAGPASASEARGRLDAAVTRFEEACRERVAAGQAADSSIFGLVSVEDYATFQAVHTRHHHEQLKLSLP